MTQLSQPAAAWYPDPSCPTQLRYWDGTSWTTHVQTGSLASPTTLPAIPSRSWPKRLVIPLAAVLVWLLVFPVALYQWRLHHRSVAPRPAVAAQPLDAKALSALRIGGRAGGPVITPEQARSVLATLWPLRERAIAAHDVAGVRVLESGPAEWGDVIRAKNGHPLRSEPGLYQAASLFVPRQTTYPARFLAEVATTYLDGTPWAEVMVFVRSSARSAWTLDLDTGWTLASVRAPLLAPLTDKDGFDVAVSPQADRVARQAPALLAAYWQQAKDEARVPPSGNLAPGAWTTDRAAQLSEHAQGAVQANGLRGRTTARAAETPLHTFVQVGGDEIACGVVWTTSVSTSGPHGYPYQQADRSNWGADLEPGVYQKVTTRYQWQTCFFVPASGVPVKVLGGAGLTEALSTGVLAP